MDKITILLLLIQVQLVLFMFVSNRFFKETASRMYILLQSYKRISEDTESIFMQNIALLALLSGNKERAIEIAELQDKRLAEIKAKYAKESGK